MSLKDDHIVTSSHDGSIRIFRLEDRTEVLKIQIANAVSVCLSPRIIIGRNSSENHVLHIVEASANIGTSIVIEHEQF